MMQLQDILEGYLKKVKSFPIKMALYICGCSFLASIVTTLYVAELITPDTKYSLNSSRVMPNIKNEASTLSDHKVQVIVERNLFNKEGEVPQEDEFAIKKVVNDDEKAIKSKLPLKLIGTIYGGNPFSGLAVVQNLSEKNMNSFLVGDSLMEEVSLVEVHRYKIIMKVEGHKEYIEQDQKVIERKTRNKKRGSSGSKLDPNKYSEAGFERVGQKVVMSTDYKEKLLTTDFSNVLQGAKADPYSQGGELVGFKFSRIRSQSIFEKAGLQDGDVVTEINGESLNDTSKTLTLLQRLKKDNASEIEFQVIRGGSPLTFNLQVK